MYQSISDTNPSKAKGIYPEATGSMAAVDHQAF
jgi:hypothetical protein